MVNSDEKADLLPAPASVEENRARKSKWRILGFIALLALVTSLRYIDYELPFSSWRRLGHYDGNPSGCPQSDALYPDRYAQLWKSLGNDFDQDAFTKRAAEWLGGALRIPYVATCPCDVSFSEACMAEKSTESYDDMGPVGTDGRWEVFGSFHDYLLQSFPLT
jgi:hypothetical protein